MDPNRGGIPNLRVEVHEDIVDKEEPEIVEPSDILDNPSLMCPHLHTRKETEPTSTRSNDMMHWSHLLKTWQLSMMHTKKKRNPHTLILVLKSLLKI